MREITGSTANEVKMIRGIQRGIGALDNGVIGNQTLSDLAIKVADKSIFPLTLMLYSQPTIIARDIVPFTPSSKYGVGGFQNTISGSFTYPRAETPCSILVYGGKAVCGSACHVFLDKPEGVVYLGTDNKFRWKRVKYSTELPPVKWAVGGLSLINYDPVAEGFTGKYSDVLRQTNHTVLGIHNDMRYLVFFKNMNAATVSEYCKNKFKFQFAVMLDGGEDISAINGSESFAKINTSRTQGYMIQGV